MLDYQQWIERALTFVNRCEQQLPGEVKVEVFHDPPLPKQDVDRLARELSMGLPQPLRRFLHEGAARFECRYIWEPHVGPLEPLFSHTYLVGGPCFDSAGLVHSQELCRSWAESFDSESSVDDIRLWKRCVPFSPVGNGDHLAFDVASSRRDPPIAYLSHEGVGGSTIIAATFDEFLVAWEELCYLDPLFLMEDFVDVTTGRVNSRNEKAGMLRKLFSASKYVQ